MYEEPKHKTFGHCHGRLQVARVPHLLGGKTVGEQDMRRYVRIPGGGHPPLCYVSVCYHVIIDIEG